MPDATPDPLPQTLNDPPKTILVENTLVTPPVTDALLPRPLGARWPSVPGYEILDELGRGGMGVVYKARQTRAGRVVALKMILASLHAGLQDRIRFRIEAEAVARLHHPNIVQLYDVGELQTGDDELPFFSLEFVEGGALAQKMTGAPLPPVEAAALVEKLARAMHYAHSRGVVHRDLKPANVLLTPEGEPKIADFGLAKRLDSDSNLSRSGAILGTPYYMAPEQAEGRSKDVGPSSDVWSLGAILYEMLAGLAPFKGDSAHAVLQQVIQNDPEPLRRLQPRVPADLETICLKCLHKEPGRRYSTAGELAEDLRRFRLGEPIRARPVGRVERLAKWVRRRPATAALAGVSIVAALALLGLGVWYNNRLLVVNASLDAEQKRTFHEYQEAHRQHLRALEAEATARRGKEIAERALAQSRQRAALGFLAYGRSCALAARLATLPQLVNGPTRAEFRTYYDVLTLTGEKEVVEALKAFHAGLVTPRDAAEPADLRQLSLQLAHACRDYWWLPIKKDYPEVADQVQRLIYERACDVVDELAHSGRALDSLLVRHQFWELYWGEMGIIEADDVRDVMIAIGQVLDAHANLLNDAARKEIGTLAGQLRAKCGVKTAPPHSLPG